MVVGGSRQETLDSDFVLLGTRQQGVPVILRELVLPGGFNLVSPSSTVRDVIIELSEPSTIEYLYFLFIRLLVYLFICLFVCFIYLPQHS
ncbi:unnamed protein product [Schistosoma curassoni]|uniref:Uncharacterized protein n=1 Tax=Schistosoma curassoni TaxID=6186 RepID=A0A183KV34_9TREM|nr:unnamed protein product [Schistosoma curassoni]